MGCTASRGGAAFSERDKDRFGSLRRVGKSSSFTHLRSTKPRDLHYDYHVVALTSSTYGLMKLLETENVNEHLVSVIGGKGANTSGYSKIRKPDSITSDERPSKKWTDMAMGASRFKLEQLRKDQIEAKYPLNPKEAEEAPGPSEAETINTWELMEGLDEQTTPLVTPLTTTTVSTKEIGGDLLNKVSDAPMVKALPRSRSLSAVDGLKMLNKGGIARPDLVTLDSTSSVAQTSTNRSSEHSNRGSTDLSSVGSMDYSLRSSQPLSSTGLPAEFPQQYSGPLNGIGLPVEFAQRYSGPLNNAGAPLSFSQRYSGPLNSSGLPAEFLQRYSGPLSNAGLPTGQVMGFPVQDFQTVFPSVSDVSLGDETTNSNLFDPDILATFQNMIHLEERSSSEDDWYHVRSSDGEASTSSSTDDGDSPVQWASRNQNVFENSAKICDGSRDASQSGTFAPRRISFAKVMPVDPPEIADPLLQFERKCPPGGERRVVLYLTSLRGVRKTFEDCHSLKMILQSFPVWVDERDVSMHAEFRQEVTDLLGGPVIVPRVFIKGHYIGGPDEVRRLHEDGKLGVLLQDLPVVQYRKPCDGCGGVRFVPCPECSGSCKIITDTNDVAQCPDCNENGLIRCPVCF